MTKQELRNYIRNQRDRSLILDRIMQPIPLIPRLADAHTLLMYSALPDEVPTQSLIDELAAQGKTVLLPRVVNDTEMELRRYQGRDSLQAGAFGILEPTGTLFTDYDRIDVAIVPGMAFDKGGHRLGRGKGYYDRFLARVPYIYKIGLCFPWQMVEYVPTDDYDIPMDEVITVNVPH